MLRIGLANIKAAPTAEESVRRTCETITAAAAAGCAIVCFPECYVPGYSWPDSPLPPADRAFLEDAWRRVAERAGTERIAVVLGTDRVVDGAMRISTLVIDHEGRMLGFQDKVQLDPSEEERYQPGEDRRTFDVQGVTVGISICHEGFRYPETVRWAAQRGAQVVFHPHVSIAEPGAYRPTEFAESRNTFHEKALLCRAAENGCYVASVNCASEGSPTTSAVISPDGSVLAWQPYGVEGVLVADLDLDAATLLLARRYRGVELEAAPRGQAR